MCYDPGISRSLPLFNSENMEFENIKTNSWFSSTLNIDKNRESAFFVQTKNVESKEMIRMIKIEVKPTKIQKVILLNWMKLYRLAYNTSIKYFKHKFHENEQYSIPTYFKLRSIIKNYLIGKYTDFKKFKFPMMSIDRAIQDVYSNYEQQLTVFKKSKNTSKFLFTGNYKKSSSNREIIKFESCLPGDLERGKKNTSIRDKKEFIPTKRLNTIYKSILGKHIETNVSLEDKSGMCVLQLNKCKNSFCLFVRDKVSSISTEYNGSEFISLDPGVRTFQTGYDTKGNTFNIGYDSETIVYKLFCTINRLKARYKNTPFKRILKRIRLYQNKIKNLTNDLHWKTIKFLTDNYGRILIGKLNSGKCIQTKNLSSITKLMLQSKSHYTFRSRLKYKCELNGIFYNEIHEFNTSKSCGNCGFIKKNLGSSKIFNCDKCTYKCDRDINAARNIMMKFIISI
jgi:putative transposase